MRLTGSVLCAALALAACSQAEEPADPAASESPSSTTPADEPSDATPATQAASGPLAPRDECTSVEGLGELQTKLKKAVAARDADALMALVDKNVQLDFGGGSGQAELHKRLTSPDYLLWDEIEQALALGCGFDKSADGNNYATWPWYFSKDVIPLDPFEAMIVTGGNVPLRDGASATAKQIGTVSWDYVQLKEYSEDPYLPVVTSDGKAGFMEAKKLRSLVDYRIMADKIDGKWKVTTIIAGD